MSKLYNQYLELKKDNPSMHYLFHSGIFYLFLDDDAKELAPLLSLKLLPFSQNIEKCGFPESGLTKYEDILKEKNIMYQIIERTTTVDTKSKDKVKEVSQAQTTTKENPNQDIYSYLNKIDLYRISPMDAFQILVELKEKYKNE